MRYLLAVLMLIVGISVATVSYANCGNDPRDPHPGGDECFDKVTNSGP